MQPSSLLATSMWAAATGASTALPCPAPTLSACLLLHSLFKHSILNVVVLNVMRRWPDLPFCQSVPLVLCRPWDYCVSASGWLYLHDKEMRGPSSTGTDM